ATRIGEWAPRGPNRSGGRQATDRGPPVFLVSRKRIGDRSGFPPFPSGTGAAEGPDNPSGGFHNMRCTMRKLLMLSVVLGLGACAGDDGSGDDVSGDDVSGDDTAGDDTAGDDTAGDDTGGDDGAGAPDAGDPIPEPQDPGIVD